MSSLGSRITTVTWGRSVTRCAKARRPSIKLTSLLIRIVVALAVASLRIEQYPLCLIENLCGEAEEKSPSACIAKERIRYPALGEEGADEDRRIKHGAWHGLGDTL